MFNTMSSSLLVLICELKFMAFKVRSNIIRLLSHSSGTRDPAVIKKALSHVVVPEFVPKKGIKINTDENAKEGDKKEPEPAEDDDDTARRLLEAIPPAAKFTG